MRKLIIDTDCGSDDAVALIMALKSKEVSVEAITTVGGNVPMELATQNALMTMEITGAQMPPLYAGAAKPLFRELVTAVNVHGEDGMGDLGLIHPAGAAEAEHAADAILRIVKTYPDEIEIVTIGPVTNVALAIMKDPAAMKRVKHIYSMGTTGFGPGNCTPVSEFNIYVDAEAFHRMITAGIPVTIVGFDLCLGDAVLTKEDMEALMNSGKEEAVFSVKCNRLLAEYNLAAHNQYFVDLPDAVAMAVALWDDIAIEKSPVTHMSAGRKRRLMDRLFSMTAQSWRSRKASENTRPMWRCARSSTMLFIKGDCCRCSWKITKNNMFIDKNRGMIIL